MLVSSSRSFNRYRDVCFPKGQKLRADASSCRKILEAADCRGWQRGKTKLFLKYEHIKNLVGVLDKKAAEEDARLAAIEASRAKREAEERAFEERRAKEVAVIRKAAEAQPSATQKENEAAAELAKLAKKKKPKKGAPVVEGSRTMNERASVYKEHCRQLFVCIVDHGAGSPDVQK